MDVSRRRELQGNGCVNSGGFGPMGARHEQVELRHARLRGAVKKLVRAARHGANYPGSIQNGPDPAGDKAEGARRDGGLCARGWQSGSRARLAGARCRRRK